MHAPGRCRAGTRPIAGSIASSFSRVTTACPLNFERGRLVRSELHVRGDQDNRVRAPLRIQEDLLSSRVGQRRGRLERVGRLGGEQAGGEGVRVDGDGGDSAWRLACAGRLCVANKRAPPADRRLALSRPGAHGRPLRCSAGGSESAHPLRSISYRVDSRYIAQTIVMDTNFINILRSLALIYGCVPN
eukprot:3939386-Prymnesium_polylepis.1